MFSPKAKNHNLRYKEESVPLKKTASSVRCSSLFKKLHTIILKALRLSFKEVESGRLIVWIEYMTDNPSHAASIINVSLHVILYGFVTVSLGKKGVSVQSAVTHRIQSIN